MSDANNSLNPNVYLNYLQLDVASEYEITRDIFLATFGVQRPLFIATMMIDSAAIGSTLGHSFQPTQRLENNSNN